MKYYVESGDLKECVSSDDINSAIRLSIKQHFKHHKGEKKLGVLIGISEFGFIRDRETNHDSDLYNLTHVALYDSGMTTKENYDFVDKYVQKEYPDLYDKFRSRK